MAPKPVGYYLCHKLVVLYLQQYRTSVKIVNYECFMTLIVYKIVTQYNSTIN